ncbi:hypothetical protein [Streptomyces sp. CA-111067]|uniref:hypothetical protein n=1 Tax=Streptomyces sp. CA-111067 TaxID=3240046 RepID=UPI003D983C3D
MKPWLFLDVDGPLNPYAAPSGRLPRGYALHRLRPTHWPPEHPDLPVWLDPGHGAHLDWLTAHFSLVWATTWEDDANTMIGPLIGLPELPVVHWPEQRAQSATGLFWKTAELVRFADGAPFAWVDDEVDEEDRAFVAAHHPAPALLHRIDPRVGLRSADFATLGEWAVGIG